MPDGLLTSIADQAKWIKTTAHQALAGIEIDHALHLI